MREVYGERGTEMSTGVQILLIVSGTLIVLTGLFLWAAVRISKRAERQEAEFWKKEWEKIQKEEDTGVK